MRALPEGGATLSATMRHSPCFCELPERRAPSWDVSELHSDMKWSTGIGVRVFAKGIIARIDGAASEEGFKVQMMVNNPFQF